MISVTLASLLAWGEANQVGGALVGVEDIGGHQRVAVVEGQARAQLEGVLEPIRRDLPGLSEIGNDAEVLVELDQAGEEARQDRAGDDPLRELAGIERSRSG